MGSDLAGLGVAYRIVESPFGALLVAATAEGVVRVAFEREDHDQVLANLSNDIGSSTAPSPHCTDDVARQFDEYFDGRRQCFELAIDLQLVEGFRREVVLQLGFIPYGSTATYAAVANAIGRAKAVRAVGSACAQNPIPIVVPCHRVVRSDGSIGQYLGGSEMKAALLAMESAPA